MGEGQILAQVKSVYQVGQTCTGFGRHLNGLFKQAITAGKRVRAETSISSGAVSVSSAAAELAQLKLPTHDFADSKVHTCGLNSLSLYVSWLLTHALKVYCSQCTGHAAVWCCFRDTVKHSSGGTQKLGVGQC